MSNRPQLPPSARAAMGVLRGAANVAKTVSGHDDRMAERVARHNQQNRMNDPHGRQTIQELAAQPGPMNVSTEPPTVIIDTYVQGGGATPSSPDPTPSVGGGSSQGQGRG